MLLWKYNAIVIGIPSFQYAEIGLNGSFLLSTYVCLYPSTQVHVQENIIAVMELCLYSPCFFLISVIVKVQLMRSKLSKEINVLIIYVLILDN